MEVCIVRINLESGDETLCQMPDVPQKKDFRGRN